MTTQKPTSAQYQPAPRALVFPSEATLGFDGTARDGRLRAYQQQDIVAALNTRYRTDAHCASYYYVDQPCGLRLNKNGVAALHTAGIEVRCGLLFLDQDTSGHKSATHEWWNQSLAWAKKLDAAWYATRGGARFVWQLVPALSLEQFDLFQEFLVNKLQRLGLSIDDKALGWSHLMRLPHTVRPGGPNEPQELKTHRLADIPVLSPKLKGA